MKQKGPSTVVGKGEPHFLPQYAGMLNGAFSHSLDFDDTYIDETLHAGCTSVAAALTQAELLGANVTADELVLAISVAYEITCRVGRELGFEAYTRGFHNTSTAGIFGAVAGISVLRRLSAHTVEMAFGIAGSKAGGSMQYLDNGSWNKRLHAGFAVHDAFISVQLAESGVIGATRSIEGRNGFLHAYSPNPNKDIHHLVSGLGSEWVWLASAIKPYPACRMTHALIELSGKLHTTFAKVNNRPLTVDEIQSITVWIGPNNFILVGDPTPNKIHPKNIIDGQFSVYFQVANALLYGEPRGLEAYAKIGDTATYQLTSKISVIPDASLIGFPARLRITWKDGLEEDHFQQYALGEVEHPFSRERVLEKYLALASPAYGRAKAEQILAAVDSLESQNFADLIRLLQ